MKNKIFDKKIQDIIEQEKPYGILLIGSLSRIDKLDLENVRDIDIFVITDTQDFQREVVNIEDLEFDISYMPISLLEQSIKKELSSIISVTAKSKTLYISKDNAFKNTLKVIKSVYEERPRKLEKIDIRYKRFKITQSYLTLKSRKSDKLNFNFLKHIFIKELLETYFNLNNIWMPPDKRMLSSIEDKKITSLLEEYLLETDRINAEDQLKYIDHLFNTVLEPFGGRLEYWERDSYPYDFL